MRRPIRHVLNAAFVAAWALLVGFGVSKMWSYEGAAGAPARPPLALLPDSIPIHDSKLPQLILLLHPRCPCSRATIGELAKLMARCNGKLHATVLFVRPANVPAGWEQTDLWSSAAAIPGVSVAADDQGRQASRLGAATSGQALLYDPNGRLLFSGGITESRGHGGDNAGESAIEALVLNTNVLDIAATAGSAPGVEFARTPVYGCALFNSPSACQKEGSASWSR